MTAEKLLEFLKDNLALDDVTESTELFSSGLLDSVSMLELISFIEEGARIQVSQEDVTLENFDSVEKILKYVADQA